MEIRIEILDAETAKGMEGFIMPGVAESPDFENYAFYGAIDEKALAGLLVMDPRLFEPEILSVAVSPEYQGMGVATALVQFAIDDMMQNYPEEDALENRVVARVIGKEKATAGIRKVLHNNGFEPVERGDFFEATVGMIKDSPFLQDEKILKRLDAKNEDKEFFSFWDMDKAQLNNFCNSLYQQEELPGIDPEDLDKDISWFALQDDKVIAAILFAKEDKGVVQNLLLYMDEEAAGDSQKDTYLITHLINIAAKEAAGKYPEDTRLSFWIDNGKMRQLLKKAFPGARVKEAGEEYELAFSDLTWDPEARFTDELCFLPV